MNEVREAIRFLLPTFAAQFMARLAGLAIEQGHYGNAGPWIVAAIIVTCVAVRRGYEYLR